MTSESKWHNFQTRQLNGRPGDNDFVFVYYELNRSEW